MVFNKCT